MRSSSGSTSGVPANPLIRERDLNFLLYDVHHIDELWQTPGLAHCDRELVELYLANVARFARHEALGQARELDEAGTHLQGGEVQIHPAVGRIFHALVELGMLIAWQLGKIALCRSPQDSDDASEQSAQTGRLCSFRYWIERELGTYLPALERLEALTAGDCDMHPDGF